MTAITPLKYPSVLPPGWTLVFNENFSNLDQWNKLEEYNYPSKSDFLPANDDIVNGVGVGYGTPSTTKLDATYVRIWQDI
jgi:hypothetical protein